MTKIRVNLGSANGQKQTLLGWESDKNLDTVN